MERVHAPPPEVIGFPNARAGWFHRKHENVEVAIGSHRPAGPSLPDQPKRRICAPLHSGVAMSDLLTERLNKILPRVVSNDFLKGTGIGNEIAFYIFDYPPEDELRVREHIRFLLEHIPKQKLGLRVKHIDLFDFVLDYLKSIYATQ
ncbi:MAG: hypothetical protein ABR861_08240 [Terriglobales bacterium]|jgi:hypothetical protein